MNTPKNISNTLIRDFFKGRVSYNSEQGLAQDLENDEEINGGDLVEHVACFYQSCKDHGIL